MGMLTTNFRVLWPYTVATIPLGWTRDTAFDDRYLQGQVAGSDPATNGGAVTHTHTSSHLHAGNAHTHTIGTTQPSGGSTVAANTQDPPSANATVSGLDSHTHSNVNSASATVNAGSKSLITTAVAMQPPFVRHIIIQPTASADIPSAAVVFFDSSAIPTGYNLCDGTSGTTDLNDCYILGAVAAGDGGGTGGTSTHGHAFTPHTHIAPFHSHTGASASASSVSSDPVLTTPTSPGEVAPYVHHSVALDIEAPAFSTESVVVNNVFSDPAYVQLFAIQNIETSESTPDGVIVPYVGTVASVASLDYGWILCDGTLGTFDLRANQIKCTTASGSIGATGGSNTHLHTTVSHYHTVDAHSHEPSITNIDNNIQVVNGSGSLPLAQAGHSHASWTISSESPTTQTSSFSTASTDARYTYRTVLFLKLPTNKVTVTIKGGNILGANIL